MAQILCWDIQYQPQEKPWSIVHCADNQKVLDYLNTDSILLVSESVWKQKAEQQILILMKLHCQNLHLAVIGKRMKKSNAFVFFFLLLFFGKLLQ
jgi:hypothetical protein